jgi:hypothetical protein
MRTFRPVEHELRTMRISRRFPAEVSRLTSLLPTLTLKAANAGVKEISTGC